MANVLLILHVFGLMLGAAGGFGAVVTLGHARPATKQKGGPLRGVNRVFPGMSLIGVLILWPTGIALMATQPGAYQLTAMFWMKMGFVVLLTVTTMGIEMIYGRAKREPHLARLLPSLHPLAALSYIMIAVFSVLAFSQT